MTERSYAIAAVSKLIACGWTLTGAWDGGEMLRDRLTPTKAVDWVQAVEQGSIRLIHPTFGRVTLYLLFQGGEAEEVVYDYGATDPDTLEIVSDILAAVIA